MSYYDPDTDTVMTEYADIVYRVRRVIHTAKEHSCLVCTRLIPKGQQAIYTFTLSDKSVRDRPQYGYQCPASLGNEWYCNLYTQGGDSD